MISPFSSSPFFLPKPQTRSNWGKHAILNDTAFFTQPLCVNQLESSSSFFLHISFSLHSREGRKRPRIYHSDSKTVVRVYSSSLYNAPTKALPSILFRIFFFKKDEHTAIYIYDQKTEKKTINNLTEHYHHFRASKSVDQQILCNPETSSYGFSSSLIVKKSVGRSPCLSPPCLSICPHTRPTLERLWSFKIRRT